MKNEIENEILLLQSDEKLKLLYGLKIEKLEADIRMLIQLLKF